MTVYDIIRTSKEDISLKRRNGKLKPKSKKDDDEIYRRSPEIAAMLEGMHIMLEEFSKTSCCFLDPYQ